MVDQPRERATFATASNSSPTVSIGCGVIAGVDALPITVEARMLAESSAPRILGSVDQVVREAFHRILSAFGALGLPTPRGSPVFNFVPADVRKAGSAFDLPMALALAAASGILPPSHLIGLAAFGEVTLDGQVRSCPGIVPMTIAAVQRGWSRVMTAPDDAERAALVPGAEPLAVCDLRQALTGLASNRLRPVPEREGFTALLAHRASDLGDLADIRGHESAKLALVAAAAGRHDLLLVGPPGSGKSALLRRIGGILPPLDREAALEVLKIHSAHGQVRRSFTALGRPLRAPHHTSSAAAILGGGPEPRPGEVTLAHHGVLFLDELPEFRREVLEGLRQPLEDRLVTLGRARRTITMPADFLLVAAMNPCPCGFATEPRARCNCSPGDRRRYTTRVSGPLLDRFDLRLDLPSPEPEAFASDADPGLSTAALAQRVAAAVERQLARNPRGVANGRLEGAALDEATGRDSRLNAELERAMRLFRVSARGRTRILRLARTLADIENCDRVAVEHLRHAVRMRGVEA